MARRGRQSLPDIIVEVVSRFPWWIGVALAVASYLVFHWWAGRPAPAVDPARVAAALPSTMTRGLAMALQYVAPLVLLVAAVVSFIGRRRRTALVDEVASSGRASALNGMSWREFEMLVGEAFRRQGYAVQETGGGGADGGVDLVLRKEGKSYLVQCKQWKAYTVPVQTVRELYGVMVHREAAGAFVVTSGRFTPDAKAFAKGKNIRLIDGEQLVAQVQAAKATFQKPQPVSSHAARSSPSCPACGSEMTRRTAKKGANVGSEFWGCMRYPACRGTR